MTEKGFEFKLCSNGYNYLYKNNELYITEKGDYVLLEQKGDVVELLNELNDEKKELQFQCNLLREQSNEFHRRAIENANRVGQLEKENKELKEKNKLIFEQIRAFGKSHHADMDFDGSRVANQLLYYLKDLENGD